ncbi:MAG: hypothetical protein GY822_11795 [Deltaproteobacteria bacterium]|nr:hypothetical protein [Deltaproteobacteria bacterium]
MISSESGAATQKALQNARAPMAHRRKACFHVALLVEVKGLQEKLKAHGADISPDGVYGVGTERSFNERVPAPLAEFIASALLKDDRFRMSSSQFALRLAEIRGGALAKSPSPSAAPILFN